MTDMVELTLILIDVALTLVNACLLGCAIKLYTDHKKQSILRGIRKR